VSTLGQKTTLTEYVFIPQHNISSGSVTLVSIQW